MCNVLSLLLCCFMFRQKPLSRPSERECWLAVPAPAQGSLLLSELEWALSVPESPAPEHSAGSVTSLSHRSPCRRSALASRAVHTNSCSEVGRKSCSPSSWHVQASRHRLPGRYQRAGAYGSMQSNGASFHPPSPSSQQQDTDPGTEQPHRLDEGLDLGMGA